MEENSTIHFNLKALKMRMEEKMKIHILILMLLIFCATTVLIKPAYSLQTLKLTLTTNKETYELGETVQIQGNLTLDDTPVQDGLVAIEVDNSKGNSHIIRTLRTGSQPPQNWNVQLVEVIPCDYKGNPQSSFQRGTTAYFKITIKSTDTITRTVALSINLYYLPSMISFIAFFPITNYQLYPGQTPTFILQAGEIPSDAPIGEAIIYACIFNKPPKEGGTAYSEEKSATFTITATAGGSQTQETETTNLNTLSTEGTFTCHFQLPTSNGILGQYTIYANAIYKTDGAPLIARASKTFQVNLTGDINGDGIVDYKDIGIVCRAFGSYPGHPKWDSRADLNGDEFIDYMDIGICCRNFGKSGTY